MKSIETGRGETAYSLEIDRDNTRLYLLRSELDNPPSPPPNPLVINEIRDYINTSFDLEFHRSRHSTIRDHKYQISKGLVKARQNELSPDLKWSMEP